MLGVPGAPGGEGEVVAALQALGYSLAEARAATRGAGPAAVEGTLEDRVKGALRGLLRD
jgi:Holliday junction resolvasome RuvABC DNA-binding subunit